MRPLALLAIYTFFPSLLPAQDTSETWSTHYQITVIQQAHAPFRASYSGTNSLIQGSESILSVTSTLFLGCRTWHGGEFYVNPELSGGGGFSNTRGIAGFPNGEVYRVDNPTPRVFLARLFLRQHFPLGDAAEQVDSDQNQMGGRLPGSRLTVTLGKFSLTDVFDDNTYSHDARTQFMNWALWSGGAWDYAADTRGYTWGLMGQLRVPRTDVNLALVMVPTTANGPWLDHRIDRAYSINCEIVREFSMGGEAGKVHLIGFLNRGYMGGYRDALTKAVAEGGLPDVDSTGRYSPKYGFVLSAEQSLGRRLGAFARLSWNDGRRETWAFTEIDMSAHAGVSAGGASWNRSDDRAGIAYVINGLSRDHRDYLAAGGYGFLIGDGALGYAPEQIVEAYYSAGLFPSFTLTLDDQIVINPAYNSARGPVVHIVSVRAHIER